MTILNGLFKPANPTMTQTRPKVLGRCADYPAVCVQCYGDGRQAASSQERSVKRRSTVEVTKPVGGIDNRAKMASH